MLRVTGLLGAAAAGGGVPGRWMRAARPVAACAAFGPRGAVGGCEETRCQNGIRQPSPGVERKDSRPGLNAHLPSSRLPCWRAMVLC